MNLHFCWFLVPQLMNLPFLVLKTNKKVVYKSTLVYISLYESPLFPCFSMFFPCFSTSPKSRHRVVTGPIPHWAGQNPPVRPSACCPRAWRPYRAASPDRTAFFWRFLGSWDMSWDYHLVMTNSSPWKPWPIYRWFTMIYL